MSLFPSCCNKLTELARVSKERPATLALVRVPEVEALTLVVAGVGSALFNPGTALYYVHLRKSIQKYKNK